MPSEVDNLIAQLATAGRGESFIVQGGDCAERFMDCEGGRLDAQVQMMVQIGAIVSASTGKPCVRLCRLAGQYGKPRSKPTETVAGFGEIYSFKGDNINGYDPKDRKWDPQRLLQGYWHSAATLNYVRGLQMAESFGADMLGPLDVGFLSESPQYASWSAIASAAKASAVPRGLFTSHEAMQLDLEEALTRAVAGKGYYNLSAHMVWIGDRTRQLLGGHVEYFRGIKNPIGCKVGPSMQADELKQLVKILNPDNVEGKLVRPHLPEAPTPEPHLAAGAHHALRQGQGGVDAAAAHQGGAGVGDPRRVAVGRRPRQHGHRAVEQAQDARLRRRRDGAHQGDRDPQGARLGAGRRAHRDDRPEDGHRVHGRP
eukprot:4365939-Prymnesium_polylepis.1